MQRTCSLRAQGPARGSVPLWRSCTPTLTAAFAVAEAWKQTTCPLAGDAHACTRTRTRTTEYRRP